MNTDPVVDIVMLVHDRADWADLAIRAVERFTRNRYRLIIVDMGSKEDATKAMLLEVSNRGHDVIHLADNRSFSHGVNVGIENGFSPYIIILNDDAIVTEGWDSALLQDASSKFVGLVGARSNYVSGAQGDPNFVGKPPYLVFVCVCMRRAVWSTVGPMDEETFDGFSSEDLDYSWRVLKAGLELRVSNAYVLHAGSRTLAVTAGDVAARVKNDQKYNARLVAKWGKEWATQHSKLVQSVFVVSYHAEEWTRVKFMDDFVNLKAMGGYAFSFFRSIRSPIHFARNAVYKYVLDQGFDVLVQLDDDATYPPDLIRRLLAHEKEVVTALAYQRKPPHLPCIFAVGEDGLLGSPLEGIEHTGLRQVDVSGYHCSMVRRSAIKKLFDAGITQPHGGFDGKVGEDFAVSLNFKKVGVQVWCDTDLISGHIGEPVVVDEAYVAKFKAGK